MNGRLVRASFACDEKLIIHPERLDAIYHGKRDHQIRCRRKRSHGRAERRTIIKFNCESRARSAHDDTEAARSRSERLNSEFLSFFLLRARRVRRFFSVSINFNALSSGCHQSDRDKRERTTMSSAHFQRRKSGGTMPLRERSAAAIA